MKDMRDLQMLNQGRFKKNIGTFCLEDSIQEILGMMKIRADLKSVRLYVDEEKELTYKLLPPRKSRTIVKDKLPTHVIGDMVRF